MKREDIRKIFPDATEEQITQILNQSGAELETVKTQVTTLQQQVAQAEEAHKAALAAQSESYNQQISALNEKVKTGMSEEELARQAKEEAEKARLEYQHKSNTLDAASIFVAAGLDEKQYSALLPQVVVDDVEATKTNANAIVKLLADQKAAVETATKDAVLKGNPTLSGAGGDGTITKEVFDKMSYGEQMKAITENPNLLQSFNQRPQIPTL